MKKILSLLILFSCRHICADAYENLKAAQAQFHRLIYQGGALPGVAGSAPEVAYISGFFYPPITLPADQESTEIYWALINKGMNKDPGHGGVAADGSNLQQFNALNLEALRQYNEYASNSRPRVSLTGHSVLGIAAQHPRVVITAPPPPAAAAAVASSSVVGSRSSSSTAVAAPNMGMAAGGFPFARPAQKAAVPDTSVPSLEVVKAKFTEINAKTKKFRNDEADIRILTELEGELSGSGNAGTAVPQERFEKLVIAFNYINKQEEGPELTVLRKELVPEVYAAAPAAVAKPAAVKKLTHQEELALRLSRRGDLNAAQNTAAAIAAVDGARADKEDPVKAAIALCVRGESKLTLVPSGITDNKAAVKEAIRQLKIIVVSGNATKSQKNNLQVLERRLPLIPEEDDDSEDDSEDDDEDSISHNGSVAASAPVFNIPSMPPSPVPAQAVATDAFAQAVATAAPAFNPTSTEASGREERYLTTEELDAIPGLQKFKKTQYSNDKGNGLPPEKARAKLGAGVTAKFVGDAVVVAAAPAPAAVSAPAPVAAQLPVAGNTGPSSPMASGGAVGGAAAPPMSVISSSSAPVADGAARASTSTSSSASVAVGGGAASEIPVDANGVKTYLSNLSAKLKARDYGGGSKEDQIAYLEKLLVKLSAIETSIIRGGSIEMAMNARGEASAEIKKVRDQINPALIKLRDGR